jgi:hypothetical protein
MNCANCGTTLLPGEVFCGECGQSVTPQARPAQAQSPYAVSAAPPGRAAPKLLALLAVFAGLLLLIVGAAAAWLLFGRTTSSNQNSSYQSSSNRPANARDTRSDPSAAGSRESNKEVPIGAPPVSPSQTNTPSTNPAAPATATGWGPRNERQSLFGENLTYYQGSTPEQCQADCDRNSKCKGFTFIRQGAYNPADPPMCYLASVVTGAATHDCCISAVKKQ